MLLPQVVCMGAENTFDLINATCRLEVKGNMVASPIFKCLIVEWKGGKNMRAGGSCCPAHVKRQPMYFGEFDEIPNTTLIKIASRISQEQ